LSYRAVDAIAREFRPELMKLNPRAEVPVLTDGDLVVVNSSDILRYLDWRHPSPALYPEATSDRVAARALERLADHRLDPIVVDCSLWQWADRKDEPPAVRPLGFKINEARYPTVLGWFAAMREHPVFAADRKRTAAFLKTVCDSTHERTRLFWSGDRMEWLIARGFHGWLAAEIDADHAAFAAT
jgi:glutathione S-transferase